MFFARKIPSYRDLNSRPNVSEKCGLTLPGEEGSNETGKLIIAHRSVEFCEATPFNLVDESKESLYVRETARDLCVAPVDASVYFYLFSPNEQQQRGGWGGCALPDFLFCSRFPLQQTTSGCCCCCCLQIKNRSDLDPVPSLSYSSRQRNEFPWSQANPK